MVPGIHGDAVRFLILFAAFLALATPNRSSAALTFGAAATDRVTIADSSSITALTTFSWLLWVNPTTQTALRRLVSKINNPLTNEAILVWDSTSSSQLLFEVDRATTQSNTKTTGASIPLNAWTYIAATYSPTTGTRVYTGNLTTTAALPAATNTLGSGTTFSYNGVLSVGNEPAASANLPSQGAIGRFQMFNKELSLAEIREQQFTPTKTAETVIYMELGFNGTGTQTDYSGNGNSGVVTGSSQSAHVPVKPSF